MYNHL